LLTRRKSFLYFHGQLVIDDSTRWIHANGQHVTEYENLPLQ
jgi:hypothetical protein